MNPVVLALDTSGVHCSVALVADARVADARVASRTADVGSAHAEHVLSMVDAVLSELGVALSDCDAVAYAAGPGSFTGLRVGCAVAQGLAFGAGADVVPVGTLDAIAEASFARVARRGARLLVAQDARMDEVYWATFERADDRWIALQPATLTKAAALVASPLAHADHGTGNAWTIHGARLAALVDTVHAVAGAEARDVARLGRRAVHEGAALAPDRASLLYVRDRVASTMIERAAQRDAAIAAAPAAAESA